MSQAFWDARAALGPEAGTRDRIAKQIEIEAIARYVKDGMTVLDVGCGDGETAIELAKRFALKMIDGCDFSANMVAVAGERREHTRELDDYGGLQTGFISFFQHDITDAFPSMFQGQYDLVYTQRCLINLPNWPAQRRAIGNIAQALKPGGIYVMLENSWEGLQAINDLRERVGLPRIEPPSHNRYLRDEEIDDYRKIGQEQWNRLKAMIERQRLGDGYLVTDSQQEQLLSLVNEDGLICEAIDDYSSTYYYLSRVVNAALAAQEGREPEYDSPINKLALPFVGLGGNAGQGLPPLAGLRGQGRAWIWRKT